MVYQASTTPLIVTGGDLGANIASFHRSLRATKLSPATIGTYLASIEQFARFLEDRGMPTDVANIHREHVEAFMVLLNETRAPATALNRFTGVQQFFKWALEEGEIKVSPMANMHKPHQDEPMTEVLDADELRGLLATCNGNAFEDRRDAAILRTFIGTGARLSELADLRWTPSEPGTNDLDLDAGIIRIAKGKYRRERLADVGTQATRALDRYLRVRAKHRHAGLPWLWLARKGRLTDSGVAQVVADRGEKAGIRVHAHMLRHTAASMKMADGLTDGNLMELMGWRSREMLDRYAKITRSNRAIAASRRHNPADDL